MSLTLDPDHGQWQDVQRTHFGEGLFAIFRANANHCLPRIYNQTMSPTREELDDHEREQMRRWLDTWAHVGAILEAERWARLQVMTDDEARRDARLVWEFWRPDWPTDEGEALLLHQRVFARGRSRL